MIRITDASHLDKALNQVITQIKDDKPREIIFFDEANNGCGKSLLALQMAKAFEKGVYDD